MAEELSNMGLSAEGQNEALNVVMERPVHVRIFKAVRGTVSEKFVKEIPSKSKRSLWTLMHVKNTSHSYFLFACPVFVIPFNVGRKSLILFMHIKIFLYVYIDI